MNITKKPPAPRTTLRRKDATRMTREVQRIADTLASGELTGHREAQALACAIVAGEIIGTIAMNPGHLSILISSMAMGMQSAARRTWGR